VSDVNRSGSFCLVQACLPFLHQAKGSGIVNIASGAGLLPNGKGLAAYAVSNSGVIALTKALASDTADGHRAEVVRYALKRLADPTEIAAAILFLMGPEGSFATGVALAVDGGRTFH
jgi:NAD(P)-dependent dehydrogenase (short-subunit alcohol dehydrogenase family)